MVGGRPHGARPEGLPACQGRVAGVFKQKLQCRRFDVAGAKDHVGFANLCLHAYFFFTETNFLTIRVCS